MCRPPLSYLAIALSLALGACGEDTPTQSSTLVPGNTASSLAATANSWAPIAPMPGQNGDGPAVGVVPNEGGLSKAYVFGGTNGAGGSGAATRVYDVAKNTWRVISNGTETRVFAFGLNGVGNIGDKLYFSGGQDYGTGTREFTRATWAFDPVTETLTQKADMPLLTAEGVSGVIDNRLYVLPGSCGTNLWPQAGYCQFEPIRKLFRYSPASNQWVSKANAPHYHKGAVGGVIENKFYVVGGVDDQFQATRNLDVYDPATNTWKTLVPLPVVLNGLVGAVLRGQLFVVGTSSSGIKHYAYNPTNNKWVAKAAPSIYGGPAAKVFLKGTSRMLVLQGATVDIGDHSQLYTP